MVDRVSLGLDDLNDPNENPSVSLEEIATSPTNGRTDAQLQKELEKEGAKLGFISRQPTRKFSRRRSPYTEQCNLKMRTGMRDIFQELGDRLEMFDQETLEAGILALIEKEGFGDLLAEYEKVIQKK
ncbi:hypothetical protein NBRC116494_17890 [Aurantivibrio plasticivorans]